MDEMDFVMQNPDPLPGPSLPPPLRSACPYLAAQAETLPGPAMLSPSRTTPHYDPVHSSTGHWHHHIHHPPPLPPPPPPLPPYWLQAPPAPQHQSLGAPISLPHPDNYPGINSPVNVHRHGSGPYRYSPAVPLEPLSFSAVNMSYRHSPGMPGRMGGPPPPAQPSAHGQPSQAPASIGAPPHGMRGPMLSPMINDPFASVPQQMPPSTGPVPSATESGPSANGGSGGPTSSERAGLRSLLGHVHSDQIPQGPRTANPPMLNQNLGVPPTSTSASSRPQATLDRFPLIDHPRSSGM